MIIIVILSAFLINNFKLNNFQLKDNKENTLEIQLEDDKEISIEELSKSVFLLEIYSAKDELIVTGSGFLAINNTTLITNYHVIEDGYNVLAIGDNDVSYMVKGVKGYDAELDIAILELDTVISAAVLSFGNTYLLELGEEVIAIGSPLGLKNTVSKGIVSAKCEIDGMEYIQTTAQISSGSSGGALFNVNGEVIGITSLIYFEGQNLNLAIPVEYIDKVTVGEEITELSTVVHDNNPESESPVKDKYTYIDFYDYNESEHNYYSLMAEDSSISIHFKVAEGFLEDFNICCPSWSNDIGNLTMCVYKWYIDYATTIAGTPTAEETFIDYADNDWLIVYLSANDTKGLEAGKYLVTLGEGVDESGSGVGLWS